MASIAPRQDTTRAAEEALQRVARTALMIRSTSLLLEAFSGASDDDGTAGVPAVIR